MDEQLKNSRKKFDTYASPNNVFTDEDKNRIRGRIQTASQAKEYKNGQTWFPKFLTGALAAAVICFLAIYINSSSVSNKMDTSDSKASGPSKWESLDRSSGSGSESVQNDKGNSTGAIRTKPNELTDPEGRIQLDSVLQPVYHQFSINHDDQLLKGLTPMQIFTLYFYAEEQKNYKVQYWLFNHDSDVDQPFKSEEEWVQASQNEGDTLLEKVKNSYLEEHILNESNAYIQISGERDQSLENPVGFGLSKNKAGIWKVDWMPVQ